MKTSKTKVKNRVDREDETRTSIHSTQPHQFATSESKDKLQRRRHTDEAHGKCSPSTQRSTCHASQNHNPLASTAAPCHWHTTLPGFYHGSFQPTLKFFLPWSQNFPRASETSPCFPSPRKSSQPTTPSSITNHLTSTQQPDQSRTIPATGSCHHHPLPAKPIHSPRNILSDKSPNSFTTSCSHLLSPSRHAIFCASLQPQIKPKN